MAHSAFGAMRLMAPTLAPTPLSLFLRVLVGTWRPSSRHSRRTRLLLTFQPARRSSFAARRHPHRGRRFANARKNTRNSGSSPATTGGSSRWVERCRSEEHTSEIQSPMRISYAVFGLKKQTYYTPTPKEQNTN